MILADRHGVDGRPPVPRRRPPSYTVPQKTTVTVLQKPRC